ncbi:hypothetical protein [Rhodococcus wratislaviensis]
MVDEHRRDYELRKVRRYDECRQEIIRMVGETEKRLLAKYSAEGN